MKKSKIFLSIILVVVAAFALTACGTLDFTYVQNSDGTYTHIVKVTLTEEGVKAADVGLTLDEALNALKEGFIRKDYFVSADGNTVTARKNFDSVQALQNDLIGNGIITNDVKKDENAFVVKQTIFGDIKVSGKFISTNTWWFAGVLTSGGLSQINAEKIALKLSGAERPIPSLRRTNRRRPTPTKSLKRKTAITCTCGISTAATTPRKSR